MSLSDNTFPYVSIVMPLYNKENDVMRSIDSVFSQTFDNFELIVVNDGSTDNSLDVVRTVKDERVRIINQDNYGVSAARNNGILVSRSNLIAFIDADDEWMPTFLRTILKLKTNFPDCSVFATSYLFRECDGVTKKPIIRGLPAPPWEGKITDYFSVAANSDPPLWTSAVVVGKREIVSIGLFPEGVTNGEDLLTWAKLAYNYEIAYTTLHEAVYCLRAPLSGLPARPPDPHDIVGSSIAKLLTLAKLEKRPRVGLKNYLAAWYKMRAVLFLEFGDQISALHELKKMGSYSKKSPQLYLYIFIASMPAFLSKVLLTAFNHLKLLRRMLIAFR